MRGEATGNIRRQEGISEATIRRLSNYYRILQDLEREKRETVSSEELAERYGTTSAQIRKDLSGFGSFGRRGLGYPVSGLRETVAHILGIDKPWPLVLVGAGNLGHALYHYEEFRQQGFGIVAVFDSNPAKTGKEWNETSILPMSELSAVVKREKVRIGVIAVPPGSGQAVADELIAAGISGILNFAPTKLTAPEAVFIRNVNLSIAMESLSYSLSRGRKLKPY